MDVVVGDAAGLSVMTSMLGDTETPPRTGDGTFEPAGSALKLILRSARGRVAIPPVYTGPSLLTPGNGYYAAMTASS